MYDWQGEVSAVPMQAPERHPLPLFHHLYIRISYWSDARQVRISTITEAIQARRKLCDLRARSHVANSELILYH